MQYRMCSTSTHHNPARHSNPRSAPFRNIRNYSQRYNWGSLFCCSVCMNGCNLGRHFLCKPHILFSHLENIQGSASTRDKVWCSYGNISSCNICILSRYNLQPCYNRSPRCSCSTQISVIWENPFETTDYYSSHICDCIVSTVSGGEQEAGCIPPEIHQALHFLYVPAYAPTSSWSWSSVHFEETQRASKRFHLYGQCSEGEAAQSLPRLCSQRQ